MLTSAKINLKKYIIYSIILLSTSYLTVRSFAEYLVIILVFVAACANHWMLIFVVRRQSEGAANQPTKYKTLVPMMTIGKLVLVIGALTFGVQIMGKRIIIPVLIYVLQIVVLYLSFEKPSAEKGSW
ncbi:MAG: hypothetical protein H7281_14800 [Bacteriovorax sp.]|nr:hypothetical protein [Bacteriovorax sp.]